MLQMSLQEAVDRLGITETILTTGEVGQIAGLMHKKSGKAYGKRTVSNWLRAGLLEGARNLGSAWAIPLRALDPSRFVPPRPGRPIKPTNEQSLRREFIEAIRGAYFQNSASANLAHNSCVQAYRALTADPGAFPILHVIETASNFLDWAIELGIYCPEDSTPAEWHALDQLLERTNNKR